MSRLVRFQMCALGLSCLIGLGCATGAGTPSETAAEEDAEKATGSVVAAERDAVLEREDESAPTEAAFASPFELPPNSLGATVRRLADETSAGWAVMAGLERLPVAAAPTANDDEKAARALAEGTGLALQATPHYFFLYPTDPVYARLTDLSLEGQLHEAYRDLPISLSFGAGTRLFTVLAALSKASGKTFVADNALAEMRIGELAVRDTPVSAALEALLKSARVVGFRIDSTEEYTFIASVNNANKASLLLNPEGVGEAGKAILERRVTVSLPEQPARPDQIVMTPGAEPLRDALPSLSRQLGVRVTVEPALVNHPVNPAVFSNVRIRTVMDLLLRQWLSDEYGYEVRPDRIVIRHRPAP
jgi:hypothetical protein